jgi:glutathione S-transferase
MKLLMSPTSPYARKCRIIARELDLMRLLEEVQVDLADKAELRKFNPLGKIPALALDDGSVLLDSPVICEYLDDLGQGKFFPKPNVWGDTKGRWKALTLHALGDGVVDAAAGWRGETMRPAEAQSAANIERFRGAIVASLDAFERLAPRFAQYPTIGELGVGCALGYLDLRFAEALPWREPRPQLAAWFETFSQYPAVQATKPPMPLS